MDLLYEVVGRNIELAKSGKEENLLLIQMILKTFYQINMIEVVPCLKNVNNIKPWIELFIIVLKIEIPLQSTVLTYEKIEELDSSLAWEVN